MLFIIKGMGLGLALLSMLRLLNLFEASNISLFQINKYPKAVQLVYNELSHRLSNIMNRELTSIIMEAKKPKALRLYEPSIEPV